MQSKRNLKEGILLFIIIVLFVSIPIALSAFTFEKYEKRNKMVKYEETLKKYPLNSYVGKSFITASYPIMMDCMLIGDSYAHFVAYDLGFDMTNYSCPGLTLYNLRMVFDAALQNKKKYATIFIGPNDFMSKTSVKDFEKLLRGYVDELREKMGAKVILCTYMPSELTKMVERKKECVASIEEYNKALMNIVDESNGVYYLDLMPYAYQKQYYKSTEGYDDNIHFNKVFNIKFINLLYKKLMEIEKENIG